MKLGVFNFSINPLIHQSMKPYYIIILLAFASFTYGKGKLALTPVGAEELSNVFSIVEQADKQFAASNYIVSLAIYNNAENKLGKLMESALVDPIKCREFLLEWKKKRNICEPLAARQAYMDLKNIYLTNRFNFFSSLSNGNIRTLNISFDKVIKSYNNILKLSLVDYLPENLPPAIPPDDIKFSYSDFLSHFRNKWLEKQSFTADQLDAFNQIASATSLTCHTYWLDTAKENNNAGITLPWLQKLYENLVEQEPCNYGFRYGLGNSSILQNKTQQANAAWHKALDFFPDSIYIHFHLARTCGKTKNEITRAISHLKWILSKTQKRLWRIKAHYQLANRFTELGNLDAAYDETVSAAELAAMDIVALNDLYSKIKKLQGHILLKLNKNDDALNALKSAADASPKNLKLKIDVADLLMNLANSSNELNERYAKEALIWYDRILRENPKTPGAHGSKAYIYLLMGNINSAQGEAITELSIKPDSSVTLATLGYTYLAQKNYESAKLMFKKALDFDPECSAAIDGLKKSEAKLETDFQSTKNVD